MSKFKVGDKVRFVKYEGTAKEKAERIGEEFYITKVVESWDDSNGELLYEAKDMIYCFKESELEIIEDKISKPSHYCFSKIEPIDVIQEWKLNFCLGNALKYISRVGKKGDKIEDLRKAIQYLEFEIKDIEKEGK